MKRQGGFTLVEIAIVLVIIGLLLGGVLKGQELINSAKVKSMIGDLRTTSTLVYGYQDRFRVFPGDQTQEQLVTAFPPPAAPTGCAPTASATCNPNNGRIDGNWNDAGATPPEGSAASEASVFWQHVRLANIATGPTVLNDPNYRPRNADGGFIGIESGLDAAGAPAPFIAGMRGSFYVCTDGVLGRYVRQMDTTMDDGNTAGGSLQAVPTGSTRATAAALTASIVDGQLYTVCAAF